MRGAVGPAGRVPGTPAAHAVQLVVSAVTDSNPASALPADSSTCLAAYPLLQVGGRLDMLRRVPSSLPPRVRRIWWVWAASSCCQSVTH
jgi:hypothetical protein